MIKVTNKEACCGCEACVQKCPKSCISMKFDEQGFRYPVVNEIQCVDCGLCELVCPVIHQSNLRKPSHIYGAINKDEQTRLSSSSGGLFTAFAELVVNKGGLVWGARFNEQWDVVHDCIMAKEDVKLLRGSKYVQSNIGSSYKDIEQQLKAGSIVLFSGTPCQVAGLKHFLRKDYPDLYTIDFVCHGVPSPGVWKKYLKQQFGQDSKIESINFRDKTYGWEKFCFKLKQNFLGRKDSVFHIEPRNKNLFMRAFLHDLILRPSCYNCPARSFKSGSDITLADLWGVWVTMPECNDDKGCSCIAINTDKGEQLFRQVQNVISAKSISYKNAFIDYNHAATVNPKQNPNTGLFFSQYESVPLKILIPQLTKDSYANILKENVRQILDATGLLKILRKFR